MTRSRRNHVILVVLVLWLARSAGATEIVVGRETPYVLSPNGPAVISRGGPQKSPSPFTMTYVGIHQGPSGEMYGAASSDATERTRFFFPSLSITVSAASKILTDAPPSSGGYVDKIGANTELRQLALNVQVTALDAAKAGIAVLGESEVTETEPAGSDIGQEPSLVIALFPSDTQSQTRPTTAARVMDGVSIFTPDLGIFSSMAMGVSVFFRGMFGTKDSPTQVAYLSGRNEFGWSWRAAEGLVIEGIHQCGVALRLRTDVRYLRVHADLIADWHHFGAWLKPYDFVIPVTGSMEVQGAPQEGGDKPEGQSGSR